MSSPVHTYSGTQAPEPVYYSGLEVAANTNPASYKAYDQYHATQQSAGVPYSSHGSPSPQYPNSSPAPPSQTAYSPVPHSVSAGPPGTLSTASGMGLSPSEKAPAESKILGLRRTTFFLTVLLILVIIIAAVGGGVGGSMAVENAKKNAIVAAAADGSTNQTAVTVTVTTTVKATGTGTQTTSSATSSASLFVAPTDAVIALDCPNLDQTSQIVTLGSNSYTFNVECNKDYNGDIDILAITTYSFRDCLKACSSYNRNSNSTDCKALEWNGNLTSIVPANFGNCFLKTGTGSTHLRVDNLHAGATLISSK